MSTTTGVNTIVSAHTCSQKKGLRAWTMARTRKIPEESINFHFTEFPDKSGENNWKIENELKGFWVISRRERDKSITLLRNSTRISMEPICDINHKTSVDGSAMRDCEKIDFKGWKLLFCCDQEFQVVYRTNWTKNSRKGGQIRVWPIARGPWKLGFHLNQIPSSRPIFYGRMSN